jgi:hypothetical protein
MTQRRTLIDGLKETPTAIDPDKEKAFVFNAKAPQAETPVAPPQTTVHAPNRVPISTRMRGDFANALKRASLERQLGGVEPNTLTDIFEQAIEPWLRSNGYLK